MAECIEREKIKTCFARIIVEEIAGKPYYSIMYWENSKMHIGYSSYELENVRRWLNEEFEVKRNVDIAPVVHGRCPICSGQKILTQDCDNGYSVEVDAEFGEMSIWQGDTCLTVISIDYCPNCGAKLDGGAIDG